MLIQTTKGTLINLSHAIEIYPSSHQPPPSDKTIDINVLWVGHHQTCTYRIGLLTWKFLIENHHSLEV